MGVRWRCGRTNKGSGIGGERQRRRNHFLLERNGDMDGPRTPGPQERMDNSFEGEGGKTARRPTKKKKRSPLLPAQTLEGNREPANVQRFMQREKEDEKRGVYGETSDKDSYTASKVAKFGGYQEARRGLYFLHQEQVLFANEAPHTGKRRTGLVSRYKLEVRSRGMH